MQHSNLCYVEFSVSEKSTSTWSLNGIWSFPCLGSSQRMTVQQFYGKFNSRCSVLLAERRHDYSTEGARNRDKKSDHAKFLSANHWVFNLERIFWPSLTVWSSTKAHGGVKCGFPRIQGSNSSSRHEVSCAVPDDHSSSFAWCSSAQ